MARGFGFGFEFEDEEDDEDEDEKERMSEGANRPRFRELLNGGSFAYGAELVTTRGFTPPEQPDKVVALGDALAGDPRIGWVSLTDNPGGNVMLPPDWLGRCLAKKPASIVIHLTCKDQNRNALEARAWEYASEGFENIVAMTGDYPRSGVGGNASPVFDLDSVSLLALLQAMNDGLAVPGRKGETTRLPQTKFYLGCVVNPFKRHERELMPQYFKLLRKISCGAQFVYTQLGYDLRKFHEVKLLLASHGITLPVIGNVYLLNRTVAEMFHKNQVPGCVVSDRLHALAEKYGAGPDKGRSFFRELAVKQLAAFRALGFAGGYLGGISKAETFFEIIDLAGKCSESDGREFAREIQFAQENEFYLFDRDAATGLGHPEYLNPEYVRSLEHPDRSKHVTLGYRLSRFMHDKVFTPDTPGFHFMKKLYARWDKKPGAVAHGAREIEKLSKFIWFGCKDCGDCSLPETGYLCPLVSCSKGARNGPCGGSADGQCELEDKECIWARAYERMKHYRETGDMLGGPAVFYDARLKGTSSWANTFLGRDHHAAGKAPAAAPAKPETRASKPDANNPRPKT
jgi:methylenetetrahydrofolate reductase (NADPH)